MKIQTRSQNKQTESEVKQEDKGPGFYWDPSYSRWVRDDKRGTPLSEWDTKVQPKSGVAYTVWPAVHTTLVTAGVKSIPAEEVSKLVEEGKAVVVDVRPGDNFEKEHVDGSLNVPLYRPVEGSSLFDKVKKLAVGAMAMTATERNPNFADDARKTLGEESRMIIVACMMGGSLTTEVSRKRKNMKSFKDPERAFGRESRSLKAAYELMQAGYENIAHLEGGIAMWRHKGLPMSGS